VSYLPMSFILLLIPLFFTLSATASEGYFLEASVDPFMTVGHEKLSSADSYQTFYGHTYSSNLGYTKKSKSLGLFISKSDTTYRLDRTKKSASETSFGIFASILYLDKFKYGLKVFRIHKTYTDNGYSTGIFVNAELYRRKRFYLFADFSYTLFSYIKDHSFKSRSLSFGPGYQF